MRYRWFLVLLLAAALPRAAHAAPRCFVETGICVDEPFRTFWERRGGLAVFGLPVSDLIWEDGRAVQYFERNRFELHPENPAPYRVLLGQLGSEQLRATGRMPASLQRGVPTPDCQFFAATGHSLCGRFRAFWERGGGLAIIGYPISELMPEPSATDGGVSTIQYFERNRLELHPENQPPYDVQASLFGTWRAGALFGTAHAASPVQATFSGPSDAQQPFDPVALAVAAPGYSGPATLRVIDPAGQLEAEIGLMIANGAAQATLVAGGTLGSHSAALLISGRIAGATSTAYTLDAATDVTTGVARYDMLLPAVRSMLARDTFDIQVGGQRAHGYRSPDSPLLWLRDHVYQGAGYRYFEPDMTSLLDHFRRSQQPNGAIDDYVGREPDGRLIQGRMEVEADQEALFAQGAYQAWQATGDDAWLQAATGPAERGLAYVTSDPQRWDATNGLIKRPFTIDTWDFELGPLTTSPDGKPALRHWIDGATRFGIMHGDNTGAAYAMLLLAQAYERLGQPDRAGQWRNRAAELMARLDALSWNGAFFRHTVHLTPVELRGVDEAQQLSLSNAYALNREVLSFDQATAILNEYQRRRGRSAAFAEWFSIDPPFPAGSFGAATGLAPGEYVNGGIMPLVGGELARGAFRWGQERYGFDVLTRYAALLQSYGGGSYLWYRPNGVAGASNDTTLNSDGWGSAAMLAALIAGAAGVRDAATLLRNVELAPRWSADDAVQQASVTVRYPASLGYVAYHWTRLPNGLRMQATGAHSGTLRLLLPDRAPEAVAVTVGGAPVPFNIAHVGTSRYVELALPPSLATVEVRW